MDEEAPKLELKGAQFGNNNLQINQFLEQVPHALVKDAVIEEIYQNIQSRFFRDVDLESSLKNLANRLRTGDYISCPQLEKDFALSWIVRLLSPKDLNFAQEIFLEICKKDEVEARVAKGFLLSYEKEKEDALEYLSEIGDKASITAMLQIVFNNLESKGAIKWFEDSGHGLEDFCSDGKHLLILFYLLTQNWDKAFTLSKLISLEDFNNTPALYYVTAISYVLNCLPKEQKYLVFVEVPYFENVLLAEDSASLEYRKIAIDRFVKFRNYAAKFSAHKSKELSSDYILWLKLESADFKDEAMTELKKGLSDNNSKLKYVPLACKYKLELKDSEIEKEVELLINRTGRINKTAALSLLAIAYKQPNAKAFLAYVNKYRSDLITHIDNVFLTVMEINALANSGMKSQALEALDSIKDEISVEDYEFNVEIISRSDRGRVDLLIEKYNESKSLRDLQQLVNFYISERDYAAAEPYVAKVFEQTKTVKSVEDIIRVYSSLNKFKDILAFFHVNEGYILKSEFLRFYYSLALYETGDVYTSLKQLDEVTSSPNIIKLKTLILITVGDWESIHSMLLQVWDSKDEYSSQELLFYAKLSLKIDNSKCREFVKYSIEKSPDNSQILIQAYLIATEAGWEKEEKAHQWIHEATKYTQDSRILQRLSVSEIKDYQSDWQKLSNNFYDSLKQGKTPIYLSQDVLNVSWTQQVLLPILANERTEKAIEKIPIPAFGILAKTIDPKVDYEKVLFDFSTLFTIFVLGKIDYIFKVFERITVPHTILTWLLDEIRHSSFHQPSLVKSASKVLDCIDSGAGKEFQTTLVDKSYINEDLDAELDAYVNYLFKEEDDRSLIVLSSPIYKSGSFLEEKVDTVKYDKFLISSTVVVNHLSNLGLINDDTKERSISFLKLHEREIFETGKIGKHQKLFITHLSLNYFIYLDLLDVITNSGLEVYISDIEIKRMRNLRSHSSFLGKAREKYLTFKSWVSREIKDGRVVLNSRIYTEENKDFDFINHPTSNSAISSKEYEVVFIDDRVFNTSLQSNVYHSLAFFEYLKEVQKITAEEFINIKISLRKLGYLFIPNSPVEIKPSFSKSLILDDCFQPSFELRAIINYNQLLGYSGYYVANKNLEFLAGFNISMISALVDVWKSNVSNKEKAIKSEWILRSLDFRNLVHNFVYENALNVLISYDKYLVTMMYTVSMRIESKDEFLEWLDGLIIKPLVKKSSLYDSLLEHLKEFFENTVISFEKDFGEELGEGVKSIIAQQMVTNFPKTIKNELLKDQEFCDKFELRFESEINLLDNYKFKESSLLGAIQQVYESKSSEIDSDNGKWILALDEKLNVIFKLENSDISFTIEFFKNISPESKHRMALYKKISSQYFLLLDCHHKWKSKHLEGMDLSTSISFWEDVKETFIYVKSMIVDSLNRGELTIGRVLEQSSTFFKNLLLTDPAERTLEEYLNDIDSEVDNIIKWDSKRGVIHLLGLCQNLTITEFISKKVSLLRFEELKEIFQIIIKEGDVFTKTAAVELGLSLLNKFDDLSDYIFQLIQIIVEEPIEGDESEYSQLSSWFILVENELATYPKFVSSPFERRLMSMSYSSLIVSAFKLSGTFMKSLNDVAKENCKNFYYKNLLDLKLEPLWLPERIEIDNLKIECIARIHNASQKYQAYLKERNLAEVLIGKEGIISSNLKIPEAFYPCHVEGHRSFHKTLDEKNNQEIICQLNNSHELRVECLQFTLMCEMYKFDQEILDELISCIERSEYRFPKEFKNEYENIFMLKLAHTAAANQSTLLAKSVRELNFSRLKNSSEVAVHNSVVTCLIASGAFESEIEYGEFIQDWMFRQIHYSKNSKEQLNEIKAHIKTLTSLEPKLTYFLGKPNIIIDSQLGIQ